MGWGWFHRHPSLLGGVGHLNKSLQCSEVSANRASVTGGAPGDRAAHSSWERGVGSEKSTPEKTVPRGCYLSRRAVFIRRAPPEAPLGVAAAVGNTALCVPEATSPRVLGTGRGEGRRDSTWGGRRGGDMLQPSDLQGLSALTLAALWLLRPQMALQGWPASICRAGGGVGAAPCSLSPSPAGDPTIICWFELYPPKWHCLLAHIGNSVMTGYDPPPPPYLILISPALHFAINDSKPAK